jgi:hypothetical protein
MRSLTQPPAETETTCPSNIFGYQSVTNTHSSVIEIEIEQSCDYHVTVSK